MNPFFNPFEGLPFLKSYLFDPGRVYRSNPKQIQNYIDRRFRKMINYAYEIPMYHKKYKDAGVHPNDIHGIKDIIKPGVNGFVYKDARKLRKIISNFIDDPKYLAKMKKSTYKDFLNRFHVKHMLKKYKKILNES